MLGVMLSAAARLCRANGRFPYTGSTWQAARGYEAAEHQLRLVGSARRAAEVPVAAIVTGRGSHPADRLQLERRLRPEAHAYRGNGTHLASLPVQRPSTGYLSS